MEKGIVGQRLWRYEAVEQGPGQPLARTLDLEQLKIEKEARLVAFAALQARRIGI